MKLVLLACLFPFAILATKPNCVTNGLIPLAGSTPIETHAIPKVPSLDGLRAKVRIGPPSERLRRMRQGGKTSAGQIILGGEDGAISFRSLLSEFDDHGIPLEGLSAEEREFVVNGITLHIAGQLKLGCFRDLKGADSVLELLGVTSFEFSDEYIAAVNFWNFQLSGWDLQTYSGVTHFSDSIHYRGLNFSRHITDADNEARMEKLIKAEIEDFRISMQRHIDLPITLTNEDVGDFLKVREVIFHLRRIKNLRRASPQSPKSLVEILQTIRED